MAKIITNLPNGSNLTEHNDLLGLNEGDFLHLTAEEKANLNDKEYATIVYINANSPNLATIFDNVNPPVINDDSLKSNVDNLYIGQDLSTWVYNITINDYVTKVIPSTSNFYLKDIVTDAGSNKYAHIYRYGNIETTGSAISYRSIANLFRGLFSIPNTIAAFDESQEIISLPIHTYPSLNELSYVKNVSSSIQEQINTKQLTLVSGTNIKTVNGNSILGSGDIAISGGSGSTDLSYIPSPIDGIIVSSTGTNATIPLADGTNAGLLEPSKYTILENTSGTNSGDNATNTQYSGLAASKQDALGYTPENIANKSDSYTTSSSTAYVSGKALVDGLGTKQNTLTNPVTGTFVAGRVPYSSSNSTLTDSSKLLWDNTNSYFEVNGNAPRLILKNNLNNLSTYFTNDANGTLFLKNHQDKTLAAFNNPVWSTDQPQMSIGNVSSIPTESQLYVYGGKNGANIDARGSATVDEANIDLEGNDWETAPNSIGLSYFGSNATSFGTVLGYPKNKLGIIRFQDTNYAIINSDKSTGVSPIRFGINQIEIGNVNDKGFSYQSDFSSVNSSNPRWLADKGYVDTKAPLSGSANYIQNQTTAAQSANMWINGSIKAGAATFTSTVTSSNGTLIGGTLTSGYISKATGANSLGNSLIYDNGNFVGIGTSTPNRKLEVSDLDNQLSLKGNMAGAPTYQSWFNSTNTRRGYFGFSSDSNSDIRLVNEENGNIYISPSNGSTIITSSVTATSYTGSATLTGTPTAPTAAPGTTGNQIATLDYVIANAPVRPYKVYTALLSQTGTSAPTATVLENTLGGTVVWTRVGNGSYRATLTGAFVLDKTTAQITGNNTSVILAAYRASDDIVAVNTQTLDDSITKGTIEIRVYN